MALNDAKLTFANVPTPTEARVVGYRCRWPSRFDVMLENDLGDLERVSLSPSHARTVMRVMNTADFTTQPLNERLLNFLVSQGYTDGTITQDPLPEPETPTP